MTSVAQLPNDIELLKALVLEKDRQIAELNGMLTWSKEKLRAWELRFFGRKSEKATAGDKK